MGGDLFPTNSLGWIGKTYYYRFEANNTALASWSEVGSFTTLSYDQGTLRINTGSDELGTGAGIFWDRGQGEKKMDSPTLSTSHYLAPDGSSWQLTKATFDFASGLLIGPNLDSVILEGVNALSLNIDGNASFEKSINGSVEFTNGYVPVEQKPMDMMRLIRMNRTRFPGWPRKSRRVW